MKLIRKYDTVYALISVAAALGISSAIAVGVLSLGDGWSYFPLGNEDLIPYRDYFFPATPLLYFQAQLSNAMGAGILGFRLVYVALTSLFGYVSYKFAREFSSGFSALTISFLTTLALFGVRYFSADDWNTQSIMYLTCGAYFVLSSWRLITANPCETHRAKSLAIAQLAVGSFLLWASVMTKQTAAVPLFAMICVFWCLNLWRSRRRLKTLSFFTIGMLLIPLVLSSAVFAYFATRGALQPMVENLFSGAGKSNAGISVLTNTIPNSLADAFQAPRLVLVLLVVASIALYTSSHRLVAAVPQAVWGGIFAGLAFLVFSPTEPGNFGFVISICLGAVIYGAFARSDKLDLFRTVSVVLAPFAVVVYRETQLTPAPGVAPMLTTWEAGMETIVVVALIGLLFTFLELIVRMKSHTFVELREGDVFQQTLTYGVIVAATFAGLVTWTISTAGILSAFMFVPFLTVLVARTLGLMEKSGPSESYRIAHTYVLAIAFAISIGMIAQPYSWWVYSDGPLLGQRQLSVSVNGGPLWLANGSAQFYEELSSAIEEASDLQGAENESSEAEIHLFAGPYANSAYLYSSIKPYVGLNCAGALWFDLCPNKLISEDLKTFSKSPADVIVWQEPISWAYVEHEKQFVLQKSNLRDWSAFMSRLERSGRYVKVAEINVPYQGYAGKVVVLSKSD